MIFPSKMIKSNPQTPQIDSMLFPSNFWTYSAIWSHGACKFCWHMNLSIGSTSRLSWEGKFYTDLTNFGSHFSRQQLKFGRQQLKFAWPVKIVTASITGSDQDLKY